MAEMTLEEAFAAATVDVPSGMVDDIFVIDAPKRKIIVPDSESVFGVETDMDVERKYFRCPRIVGDNIDLYAHKIYVVYVTAKDVNGTFLPEIVNDKYWCDDVAVDGDCITFSWVLSDNVLSKSGIIAFKILAATTENGLEKTRWNTAPAYGTILMTVPDGDDIAERYPDIVTQLLERMDAVEAIATEEAMQGYVNEYLGQHPVQLDETLTDNTKAAPAGMVGELKSDLVDLEYSLHRVRLTSSDLVWEIGKNISSAGNIVENHCRAISGSYAPMFKKIYVNELVYGLNNYPYTIGVAEYSNGAFKRRTFISGDGKTNYSVELENDTTEIRFIVGYVSSTGVVFSQTDLQYFYAINIDYKSIFERIEDLESLVHGINNAY